MVVPFLWNAAVGGQPSAATVVALDPGVTAGAGAPLDFTEYEAENGVTNGRLIGPDRTFGTLASEASGRRAVLLEGRGDYVEFRLSAPANALTVRYALADGPEGKPNDARLGVYAQSRRIAELPVTSRYCCYYGHYPCTKHVAEGGGHHFFDHARILLAGALPAGTVLRGGSMDPRWHMGTGAVWLFALDAPIKAQIDLRTTTLWDSSQEAVLLFGRRIDGLVVNGLHVHGAVGSLIELRADGSAILSGVRATGIVAPAVRRCSAFQLEWKRDKGLNRSSAQGC
jgi:alpha-1,3-glucanase-like protein